MTKYSYETIRKKALNAGYKVDKGFQHYNNGAVACDCNGKRYTGYNVTDLNTCMLVWESGCYDCNYDHLCTLEEVEDFIKSVYEEAEIEY